jgi:hypothetical protein
VTRFHAAATITGAAAWNIAAHRRRLLHAVMAIGGRLLDAVPMSRGLRRAPPQRPYGRGAIRNALPAFHAAFD